MMGELRHEIKPVFKHVARKDMELQYSNKKWSLSQRALFKLVLQSFVRFDSFFFLKYSRRGYIVHLKSDENANVWLNLTMPYCHCWYTWNCSLLAHNEVALRGYMPV